jgi:excisionase family DNA binding protein
VNRYAAKNLSPENAEAVADAVMKFMDILIDAVAGRVLARAGAQNRAVEKKSGPRLLTYAEAGERIGRTKLAVRGMVARKELRSVHPMGGRRVFIYERDLEDYIENSKFGSRNNVPFGQRR